MRVALISQEFPPAFGGGAGVYAAHLVSGLVAAGVDVTVFTVAGGRTGDVPMIAVSEPRAGAIGFWRRLPGAMDDVCRRQGPFDVIHGNGIADLPLTRRHAPSGRVVTVHHVARPLIRAGFAGQIARFRDLRGETGLVPLVEGHVMRRAHRVIAVSEATRAQVVSRCNVRAECVEVVYSGCPVAAPAPGWSAPNVRHELCSHGEQLVLAVGRLENRKGVDVLIRAWACIDQTRLPSRLVLAGNGDAAPYRALARRLGIGDRVIFTGRLDAPRLDALYDACDLFVLASRYEGFGLVTIEAMAHRKPVVMTHTGAAEDGAVGPQHGAVIPVGDVEALAGAMSRLLGNPAALGAIGERNRAYVETRFDWKMAVDATVEVYRHAIADRTAATSRRRRPMRGVHRRVTWR